MVEYTGWKPALTAALSKVGETIAVEQITLTAPLAYTLPTGTPSGVVHSVVFTQNNVGGHTVTYGEQPVAVALTAGASTTVELHPVGAGYVVRYPASGPTSGSNTGDQDLSGFAVKSANLSDLANAATARTNLSAQRSHMLDSRDFGVMGDGVTDDAPALQSLINATHAAAKSSSLAQPTVIVLPPGRVRINSTVTVPTTVRLWSANSTTIESYVGASGAAIHLTSSADGATPPISGMTKQEWITGLWLGGPGGIRLRNMAAAGTGVGLEVGQRAAGPVTIPTSRYRVDSIDIRGFGVGLKMNTINHYLGTYHGIRVEGNDTGIQWGDSGGVNSNSGENFRFVDSVFAEALRGLRSYLPGDFTFERCSFDYIGTAIELNGTSYNVVTLSNCHLEGINEGSRYAAGNGVVVSTVTDRAVVIFRGCKGPNETDRLWFRGSNLTVRGDWNVALGPTQPPPSVPGASVGLVGSGINSAGFINHAPRDRILLSKTKNAVPGADFSAEPTGVVATGTDLVKFAVTKSAAGLGVEVVAGGSESGGKALRLTIATGHNIRLACKAKIPLRNGQQRFASAVFNPSASGLQVYTRATWYDADGLALNTPSDVAIWRAENVPAGAYYMPPILTSVGAESLAERAAAVTPSWNFVNNTGASVTVDIGLLYFGE